MQTVLAFCSKIIKSTYIQPVLAIHHPPIFIPKWWFFCVQKYWVRNAKVVQISKINLFITKNELFWLFFGCDSVANQLWLVYDTVATSRKPTRKIFWLLRKRSRSLADQPVVGLRHCRDTVATNHKKINHKLHARHQPCVNLTRMRWCILSRESGWKLQAEAAVYGLKRQHLSAWMLIVFFSF